MKESVDTLLVIDNNNLFDLDNDDITQAEAFETSDRVLFNAAKGISEIINEAGREAVSMLTLPMCAGL